MAAKTAVIALAALATCGCIRSHTLIKVKVDGSGTVEQTMLANLSLVKGMLGGFGGPGAQAGPQPGEMAEADMKRLATRMGEGVTFVSNTPVKAPDGFEGSKALFSFTDISKLRVDQDPSLSGSMTGGMSTSPSKSSPVTFAFARAGGTSTLTVTFVEPAKGATTPPPPGGGLGGPGGPDMANPQVLEMMKSMFKGFTIGIEVEVDGAIVKTNADHVSGSRVTMLEMDVEKLLQDEAKLKQVQEALGPTASASELRPYLKDVNGIKMNDPVVTIQFR